MTAGNIHCSVITIQKWTVLEASIIYSKTLEPYINCKWSILNKFTLLGHRKLTHWENKYHMLNAMWPVEWKHNANLTPISFDSVSFVPCREATEYWASIAMKRAVNLFANAVFSSANLQSTFNMAPKLNSCTSPCVIRARLCKSVHINDTQHLLYCKQ